MKSLFRKITICTTNTILTTLLAFSVTAVYAQEDQAEKKQLDQDIEEILVTGSYIRGLKQEDLASPVQTISRDDVLLSGAINIADVVNNLTINTGSQNNPDAFTQNFTAGTSNINLRGMGVSATLVMLNGRRQVTSAFTTDKGEGFVDVSSLVPMIAVSRVEILKDGASALYGSDAVAGVANFHTRNKFEGMEFSLENQSGLHGSGDTVISGIYGTSTDASDFMIAASITNRDPLGTDDRRFSVPGVDDVSNAGFPGSYLRIPSLPAVVVLLDPQCNAAAAIDNTTVPAPSPINPAAGLCRFDFGSFFSIIPEEKRNQIFSTYTYDFSDKLAFVAEFGLAQNTTERRNSPSFPIASRPVIPTYHPNNPFGVPVAFIGRTQGSGSSASMSYHDSDTQRIVFGLKGDGEKWSWNADFTSSQNDFTLRAQDTLKDKFSAALFGIPNSAGVVCATTPAQCSFYNPFAGNPATGSVNRNSQAMIDSVTGTFQIDSVSKLMSLSAHASGELFDLGSGTASIAFGADLRKEELNYNYDTDADNNNYLFVVGGSDFNRQRDIRAVFVELALPFHETLDVQLAVSNVDYDGVFSTTDPKIGILWKPIDDLSIRASMGTSFRAPSLFQQQGSQTSLVEIASISQFLPVRAIANPTDPLEPEEADTTNLGFSWISGAIKLSLDYWSFDYTNAIVQENANAIVNAAFGLAGVPLNVNVRSQLDRLDPIAPYSPTNIQQVNVFFNNASTLQTDGVDFGFQYSLPETGIGALTFAINMTKVLSYDLDDPQLRKVDGLGNRNFNNFATSMPETRRNISALWRNGTHSSGIYLRNIGSYQDDQNANAAISSHDTIDVQYNYELSAMGDASEGILLTIGGVNITDEEPPYVKTNGGYDSKVHDPRGKIIYVKASIPF